MEAAEERSLIDLDFRRRATASATPAKSNERNKMRGRA